MVNPEITVNLVDLAKRGKYLMLTQYVNELLRDMCDQAYRAGGSKGYDQGYDAGYNDGYDAGYEEGYGL